MSYLFIINTSTIAGLGPRVSTDPCCWPVPPCHTVFPSHHLPPASCSILYLPCMSRQTASAPSGTACSYLTRTSENFCCAPLASCCGHQGLIWILLLAHICYSTFSIVLLKQAAICLMFQCGRNDSKKV